MNQHDINRIANSLGFVTFSELATKAAHTTQKDTRTFFRPLATILINAALCEHQIGPLNWLTGVTLQTSIVPIDLDGVDRLTNRFYDASIASIFCFECRQENFKPYRLTLWPTGGIPLTAADWETYFFNLHYKYRAMFESAPHFHQLKNHEDFQAFLADFEAIDPKSYSEVYISNLSRFCVHQDLAEVYVAYLTRPFRSAAGRKENASTQACKFVAAHRILGGHRIPPTLKDFVEECIEASDRLFIGEHMIKKWVYPIQLDTVRRQVNKAIADPSICYAWDMSILEHALPQDVTLAQFVDQIVPV